MSPKGTVPSPVGAIPDFPNQEKELLRSWGKSGIVNRYLHRNDKSQKRFSFIDGPITANNPMGVHHGWGRTYKDLWQRFYNMKGFKQRFQNGFDCQGLWVEVEVEKELGLKQKQDIENLVPGDKKASIAKFVELCKARVDRFARIQTEQSKRLGYFMDWDHSYFTLANENNYMIWYFLKKCHEKGLIYKGRDSVPWCPRCGTAISQHEMLTEDYKELTHETVFFKLPVVGTETGLLVWTTTPWTIPANVAVAINPAYTYREWKNEQSGESIIVVREDQIEGQEDFESFIRGVFESGSFKKVKDHPGTSLVGLRYEGPFDDLPRVKEAKQESPTTFHTVVEAKELVMANKGTGLLHVAPGAGQEDFRLGKDKGLSVIEVIDETATYLEGMGEFSGENAKKHPQIVIDFVKARDGGRFFHKTAKITHRYPACWRCKTELVWRVVSEWYIKMDPLRSPMRKVVRSMRWIPSFGLKRELDWIKNMQDWLISKKRYWGLALPIWECGRCGNFEVVGGKEELKQRAREGWDQFKGHSPHRPWVDEVRIDCHNCGALMERIPDVGNPWLDAGIVPFSTIAKDNRSAPLYWADKREWRRWFPADLITESFPGQFKNWFYSLIAMSTVLEGERPADTVLGFATLLGEDGRPMHKSWGNSVEFNEGADKIGVDVMRWMYVRKDPKFNLLFGYTAAANVRRQLHLILWNSFRFVINNLSLDKPGRNEPKVLGVLDRWILSRTHTTITQVTRFLEDYDAFESSQAIEDLVDDFSTWYIRRSRERVGFTQVSKAQKEAFYWTATEVLENLAKLCAPFLPFLSDIIYTKLTGEPSVHLADWPKAEKQRIDRVLERKMTSLRQIAELGHRERKDAGIKVRQPLAKAVVGGCKERFDRSLVSLLSQELNIKSIVLKEEGELAVRLDTKLTRELIEEGEMRELIRRIQEERKRLQTSRNQKVIVTIPFHLPKRFETEVRQRTQARKIQFGEAFAVKPVHERKPAK